MNQQIAIINIIASLAFIVTAIYAYSKYKKTREITNIWLSITTALSFFALAALIYAIVFSEFIQGLDVLKELRVLILLIGTTILACALADYKKTRDLAKDGKDGKMKEKNGKKYKQIEGWCVGGGVKLFRSSKNKKS